MLSKDFPKNRAIWGLPVFLINILKVGSLTTLEFEKYSDLQSFLLTIVLLLHITIYLFIILAIRGGY